MRLNMCAAMLAGSKAVAGTTFYDAENFGGRHFAIQQPLGRFDGVRGSDRSQSAIVEGGAWEICVDADFHGDCRVFVPGRYPTLGGQGSGNLDGTFNDRATSLRVERGYWIFCSDANFQGECRTFGPGEYPQLPPELDNRISSGRRISNSYPYADQPDWR